MTHSIQQSAQALAGPSVAAMAGVLAGWAMLVAVSADGRRLLQLGDCIEAPAFASDEASIYYHRKDGDRFVIYRAALTRAQQ